MYNYYNTALICFTVLLPSSCYVTSSLVKGHLINVYIKLEHPTTTSLRLRLEPWLRKTKIAAVPSWSWHCNGRTVKRFGQLCTDYRFESQPGHTKTKFQISAQPCEATCDGRVPMYPFLKSSVLLCYGIVLTSVYSQVLPMTSVDVQVENAAEQLADQCPNDNSHNVNDSEWPELFCIACK